MALNVSSAFREEKQTVHQFSHGIIKAVFRTHMFYYGVLSYRLIHIHIENIQRTDPLKCILTLTSEVSFPKHEGKVLETFRFLLNMY